MELTRRVKDLMHHNEMLAQQIWTAKMNEKIASDNEAEAKRLNVQKIKTSETQINALKAAIRDATREKDAAHVSDVAAHRKLEAAMIELRSQLTIAEREKEELHANDTRELSELREQLARSTAELDAKRDAEEDLSDDLAAARLKLKKIAEALAEKSHELQTRVSELQKQLRAAEERTQTLIDEKDAEMSIKMSEFQRTLREKEVAAHDLRAKIEATRREANDTHATDVTRQESLSSRLRGLESRLAEVSDEKDALERDDAMRLASKEAEVAQLVAAHNADTTAVEELKAALAGLREVVAMQKDLIESGQLEGKVEFFLFLRCLHIAVSG